MEGHGSIGTNQPLVPDIKSSIKACAFCVRFCDCFNIPVVTFVIVPGSHARYIQEA
jgi:acetyl-CoA carboxylase carboxyltransferase component